MSREIRAILKARPDLEDYTFIPCRGMRIEVPVSDNETGLYKSVGIYLGTKLPERVRFGVNDEIKVVAYKKVE